MSKHVSLTFGITVNADLVGKLTEAIHAIAETLGATIDLTRRGEETIIRGAPDDPGVTPHKPTFTHSPGTAVANK